MVAEQLIFDLCERGQSVSKEKDGFPYKSANVTESAFVGLHHYLSYLSLWFSWCYCRGYLVHLFPFEKGNRAFRHRDAFRLRSRQYPPNRLNKRRNK